MFKKLQEEQKVWVAHNFGDRPAWHPLMGAIEELGELAHAHLKEAQGIRNHENHVEKAKDAVADVVIYLSDYCSAMGWDLQSLIDEACYVIRLEHLHHYIFIAAQHLSSIDDPLRMCTDRSNVGYVVNNLKLYCIARDWDFEAIVQETWDKVKQRDWKKNPDKAHEEGAKLEEFAPTSENINALPAGLRKYIHDLETICDPTGMAKEIFVLQESVEGLRAMLAEKQKEINALTMRCLQGNVELMKIAQDAKLRAEKAENMVEKLRQGVEVSSGN